MSCQISPRKTAAGTKARWPNRRPTGAGATQPNKAEPKKTARLTRRRRRGDPAKGGSANEMGPERGIAYFSLCHHECVPKNSASGAGQRFADEAGGGAARRWCGGGLVVGTAAG